MKENIFVIRDPKAFSLKFGWPKDADENLKHEAEFTIRFIIKRNESLAENKKKNDIEKLLLKCTLEMIFMNTENSKTNESQKCFLNLSKILDLKK